MISHWKHIIFSGKEGISIGKRINNDTYVGFTRLVIQFYLMETLKNMDITINHLINYLYGKIDCFKNVLSQEI